VPVNGEAYPYMRIRTPRPEPGRVASQFWSANGQFSGEVVPVPGTRMMLDLNISGRTELRPGCRLILLDAILRGVNWIPQYLKVAGGREVRRRSH
jgi:hypothetical protein